MKKTQNNMAIGKHIFKRAKTGSPDIKQHPPPPLETKSANGEISFLDRKKNKIADSSISRYNL